MDALKNRGQWKFARDALKNRYQWKLARDALKNSNANLRNAAPPDQFYSNIFSS